MATAYVTSKGQLVIPAALRRKYGIKTGTKVHFVERAGEIVFQPVTKAYIQAVCGLLSSEEDVGKQLLAERRKEKALERRRTR
jgi:AbrB family looped-hinge helix DNA binding protein